MRFQIFEGEKNRKYSILYMHQHPRFTKTTTQMMVFRGVKDDLSDCKRPSFGLQKAINEKVNHHGLLIVLFV